jgi:hypothetical protein
MGKYWRCGLAAAVVTFGAHGAWAQNLVGCPVGHAMQSADPSGRTVTCVAIPDGVALQQQIANEASARQAADNALGARIDGVIQSIPNAAALQQQIVNEATAREQADTALGGRINDLTARVDALTEADIVGKWAVTGTTNCLQSSTGFNANLSPAFPSTGVLPFVSQLSGTFIGTRTFHSGGSGDSDGTSPALTFPGMGIMATGPGQFGLVGTTSPGGAAIAKSTESFTWYIDEKAGTLHILDGGGTVPQDFIAPPTRLGWTVTITNLPPYVGYVSKDRRTIVMSHPGLQVETSTVRDTDNQVQGAPTQRFCTRHRVLTRLD